LRLGEGDGDGLLAVVLAGVAKVTGAEAVGLLVPAAQGGWDVVTGPNEAGQLPSVLIERALAKGEVQIGQPMPGAALDVIVPLQASGRSVGLIHASRCGAPPGQADLAALTALANLAAAGLERDQLMASLAAADQARREFVSLTTHQLRVPLTSISGFTDLLLSGIAGPLTERQEQFMRTVQRNVGRMTVLIADLSDLNRIEDGRLPLDLTDFDLPIVIDAVLREAAPRIAAAEQGLQRQVPDGLPRAYADQAAVWRVLEKILDNAIRYTPAGGRLTVAAIQQGPRLQVTVADTGLGLDRQEQAQLFTPFFRSEAEAVREHTGWGLSLALAKALIEVQGGRLWCESEPGAGAVFHFTLPAAGTESRPLSS
jgi:signal transduction histidine kinase